MVVAGVAVAVALALAVAVAVVVVVVHPPLVILESLVYV